MSVTKVTGMMQTSTKGGDISSASPCVIDTDGDYFDVTGTTNFAAFTVAAGRRFTVQFDGILIMTHHATNLDLPGGANITTAAGDVAEFFCDRYEHGSMCKLYQSRRDCGCSFGWW